MKQGKKKTIEAKFEDEFRVKYQVRGYRYKILGLGTGKLFCKIWYI